MSSFHLCHCADIDVATRSAWQPLIRIAQVHRLPCLPRPRPSRPSIDFAKLAFPRLVQHGRSDGMAARAEYFVEVGRYRGGLGGLAPSRCCLSSPESERSQTTTCLLRVSPSLDRARRRSSMVGVQMVVVVEVSFLSTQMIL